MQSSQTLFDTQLEFSPNEISMNPDDNNENERNLNDVFYPTETTSTLENDTSQTNDAEISSILEIPTSPTVECPCGSTVKKSSMRSHIKTKKHLKIIQEQTTSTSSETENNDTTTLSVSTTTPETTPETESQNPDEHFTCECGSTLKRKYTIKHSKTKRHLKYLGQYQSQNNETVSEILQLKMRIWNAMMTTLETNDVSIFKILCIPSIVNWKDEQGNTIYYYAKTRGYSDMVSVLLDNGAEEQNYETTN